MVKVMICGKASAGKTTVADMIGQELGIAPERIRMLKFARPIYDCLRVFGESKNRRFMTGLGDLAKECFGQDIFVKLMTNEVERLIGANDQFGHAHALICDDVRYPYEYEALRPYGFAGLYVSAPELARERRDMVSRVPFDSGHNSETELGKVKALCPHVIQNDGGLEMLRSNIRKYLQNIKK